MAHVVTVIGGGPAGCSAAIALASHGVTVIVVERGCRGRDKACGDALISEAVKELDRLGLNDVSLTALGGRPFDRLDFVRYGRLTLRRRLSHPGGWTVPRARLDQALRDRATAAGVQVLYEATGVGIDGTRGTLVTTVKRQQQAIPLESAAVVLATGGLDALPGRLGIGGQPLRAASLRAYAKSCPTDAPIFSFVDRQMVGYSWCFPMADGTANVGVCTGSPSRMKRLRRMFDQYTDRQGFVTLGGTIGGPGTLWSGNGRSWHQPRGIVSCGDAAGLVDPMTGEGITGALYSGNLAGEAVAAFLDTGDQAHLQHYSRTIHSHFAARYRRPTLKRLFSRLSGTGLSR
jgi:geranylgeranyl reductase family protein